MLSNSTRILRRAETETASAAIAVAALLWQTLVFSLAPITIVFVIEALKSVPPRRGTSYDRRVCGLTDSDGTSVTAKSGSSSLSTLK